MTEFDEIEYTKLYAAAALQGLLASLPDDQVWDEIDPNAMASFAADCAEALAKEVRARVMVKMQRLRKHEEDARALAERTAKKQ